MTRQEFLNEFPKLVKSYRPAPDVADKIGAVELLMVIGPSGVGKTTIIDSLDLPFVPSCTTRAPRPGEIDGRDSFFLNDYQQVFDDISSGRFVQVAVGSGGDFYATRADFYPASGPAAMPVIAAEVPTFRRLGFARTLSAFIVPPNYEEWMRRMNTHHLSTEQLSKRLAEARRSFAFALGDSDVHFILNDNIADALVQTKNLLDGKIDQNRDSQARQAAEQSLERISD